MFDGMLYKDDDDVWVLLYKGATWFWNDEKQLFITKYNETLSTIKPWDIW